jgi:hypothetical protein
MSSLHLVKFLTLERSGESAGIGVLLSASEQVEVEAVMADLIAEDGDGGDNGDVDEEDGDVGDSEDDGDGEESIAAGGCRCRAKLDTSFDNYYLILSGRLKGIVSRDFVVCFLVSFDRSEVGWSRNRIFLFREIRNNNESDFNFAKFREIPRNFVVLHFAKCYEISRNFV